MCVGWLALFESVHLHPAAIGSEALDTDSTKLEK